MLLHKVTKFYRFVSICSLQKQFLRFSSLFATRDVSQEVTSVTQRQKFHPDDANQCLHNKSSSQGGSKYKFVQFYMSSGRFW